MPNQIKYHQIIMVSTFFYMRNFKKALHFFLGKNESTIFFLTTIKSVFKNQCYDQIYQQYNRTL